MSRPRSRHCCSRSSPCRAGRWPAWCRICSWSEGRSRRSRSRWPRYPPCTSSCTIRRWRCTGTDCTDSTTRSSSCRCRRNWQAACRCCPSMWIGDSQWLPTTACMRLCHCKFRRWSSRRLLQRWPCSAVSDRPGRSAPQNRSRLFRTPCNSCTGWPWSRRYKQNRSRHLPCRNRCCTEHHPCTRPLLP